MADIFGALGIDASINNIDLHMTPVDTYGLFECRGDIKHRVRSKKERYYYFYIDNWEKPATLCFMERGIRHAIVLAKIKASQEMIDACVTSQGKTYKDNSFAINEPIRQWLKENIIAPTDATKIISLESQKYTQQPVATLPEIQEASVEQPVLLRSAPRIIAETEVVSLIKQYDFFEAAYNPDGLFLSCLTSTGDAHSSVDLRTGLRWQIEGSDIISFRQLQRWVKGVNREQFAGHADWRLPTIEETLSLLGREKGGHGSYIHPCFAIKQGYIYTADRRKPGGNWFVDFRQARVFWASGTFAGGFARLCRTERILSPEQDRRALS